jgi:pyrroline-5-carboxylate reductase
MPTDGYLSASEVAALKLDAAEALSGLARAFIYAGARALQASGVHFRPCLGAV